MTPSTDPLSIAEKASEAYLSSISGNNHRWICILDQKEVAILSPAENKKLVETAKLSENSKIHFDYVASED